MNKDTEPDEPCLDSPAETPFFPSAQTSGDPPDEQPVAKPDSVILLEYVA